MPTHEPDDVSREMWRERCEQGEFSDAEQAVLARMERVLGREL